ncbi:MAG: lipoyl(octanoyl) transferase LipB [Fluviibacter sp.]
MIAPRIRNLGLIDFDICWQQMKSFTESRNATTPDEIWLLQHPAIYTLGLNGDPNNLIRPTNTPIIKTDRGGQITWHGPGQLIAYILLDLRRMNRGIKSTINCLEAAAIDFLASYGITGISRVNAPGVYVDDSKIVSIGLRVSRGCTYHGLSLNVNPDLSYFSAINPCGYTGLTVTSLQALEIETGASALAPALATALIKSFYDYKS